MQNLSEIVLQYYRNQNPMLLQNWKRVIAEQDLRDRKFLQCMRVRDQVANIASYDLLIRVPAPGIPDGFYPIVDSNLVPVVKNPYWIAYPDVELARVDTRPFMENFPPTMDNSTVGDFLSFITTNAERGAHLQFHEDSAVFPPDIHGDSTRFNFPFGIKGMITASVRSMELALREALRYSHVCFATENMDMYPCGREGPVRAPLFIGGWHNSKLSWDHCVLVRPQNTVYAVNPRGIV